MSPGLFARLLPPLPSQCAVCRQWPAARVCDDCVQAFAQPRARCRTCALPLDSGHDQCGHCLRTPPPLDLCLSAVPYAFPWASLIADFKFHGQLGLARSFATVLRSAPWVEPALERCDVVLPVPLGPLRLRTRGYNQALELARALDTGRLQAEWLVRVHETDALHRLSRSARARAIRGAFAVDPLHAPQLQGRHVVLVDDVMTTGVTLFEAARVLRRCGVASITAVTLARADLLH